ncbi:MAG TPA: T9SS type A sorting domain-containing protein [Chitinophagaceae bacterium]|nr:T9SS type A sorting domain-containing protein [Chitinophagaceae bacterium]MCB9054272.1 T9SS type A sorting domain-containing protein [Chitinophagales bacterium]HRX93589.1 T9SS type A sorting domain-containing protein [Chitinophagaceae bacterium]
MRKLLSILSFVLLVTLSAQAQSARSNSDEASNDRIVKTYPNPATTYITFEVQKDYRKGMILHIYNGVLGKMVYETTNIREKTTVTLNSSFTRGIYIYHLIDETGRIIESGKFQVSR